MEHLWQLQVVSAQHCDDVTKSLSQIHNGSGSREDRDDAIHVQLNHGSKILQHQAKSLAAAHSDVSAETQAGVMKRLRLSASFELEARICGSVLSVLLLSLLIIVPQRLPL